MTDSFEHHGIKGQHWHVRRNLHPHGDKQARREANAQKFVQKSDVLSKKIGELEAKPPQRLHQKFFEGDRNVRISELRKQQDQANRDAEAKRQGHLSKAQKHALIGAAVVGGVLATSYGLEKLDSGELRQAVNSGRAAITGKQFEFKQAEELKGNWNPEMINSLIVKDINPGYAEKALGANMNCRRCTFAYELRRRGYDVAATRTPTARGQNAGGILNAITTEFPDISDQELSKRLTEGILNLNDSYRKDPITRHLTTITQRGGGLRSIKDASSIFTRLALEPERSRGELAVMWGAGGGHSMAYEIVKGVPYIFDTQTGNYYGDAATFLKNMPDIASSSFTRLDNVNLDPNFLQRWVKNVD